MKCLYFDAALTFIEDYPQPRREKGEALIRIQYGAICNTDKEIIKGYKGFQGILGHEFVGIVEEAEDSTYIGKRVVGEINLGCGECERCRQGYSNHCKNRRVLGITDKDGAFAQYITLPLANLHLVPDDVADLEAVFAEPLAAALEITNQCHIKPTHKVAIVGNGKLGQLIGQVLSLTGCDLTILGKNDKSLLLFKNKARVQLIAQVDYESYFDVVVEATGNQAGLSYAQKIVKPMGKVVLKSTYHDQALLNPTLWVVKEITLVGSRCGPMDAALRLLDKKLVSMEGLIGGVYTLEEYQAAFNDQSSLKSVFKIVE
ncbi:2-deoxy-scyllo-inosamine dehydrogenase [Sporomusa ovata DSM 2662]|uniref:Threonine dehydrogenase and related Zn-dependent dehydrogenases n=1 Tax=Sporomusa ovata TaxID=2378 RepID=A0A0U1KWF8_9FIRM|nr:alcohol dehydrogenase catalytic domain-containing protein [Sporomusa ovata]EQB26933.1 threonine dehydrogenase [Sporomusa ovata DSM 2662]CQR71034.1 Threonine dehydrogenase and related Zn-dependent dehydrogenases [Sporomusa ovata]